MRKKIIPDVIYRGAKVLQISLSSAEMKVIDSYNFMSMPLSKFPKTFGLSELKKGYFPHKINVPENQNEILDFPDPEYYNPDSMTPQGRDEFYRWHNKEKAKNQKFDLKTEMIEHCRSDVQILKDGCLAFRQIFMEVTSQTETYDGDMGDPFRYCITIASLCNRIWRKYFLEDDLVGIIPANGYLKNTHQSVAALRYFRYLEVTHLEKMYLHYGKGQEEIKAGLKVDCYIPEDDMCIEFSWLCLSLMPEA